jgi:hypothetical protein
MTDKKDSTINKILDFPLKNKLTTSITFIIYLLIYKAIDMNTIQWFGDDMFIREGNILEFIVVAVFMGSCVIVAVAVIADALKGRLF